MDRNEFDKLLKQNYNFVLSNARELCSKNNNLAFEPEDLTIRTFERIWHYASRASEYPNMQYNPSRGTFRTFAVALQKNLFLYMVKRPSNMSYGEDLDQAESVPATDDTQKQALNRIAIEFVMDKVCRTDQERLLMDAKIRGCSLGEIAVAANMKRHQARMVLLELQDRARSMLGGE